MVSFNCDGCGDVVKKPKLDQHYLQRCRAPFTCLDCSTQFNNPGQWKPHTSCISEEAKYQKSVYKGPKGKGKNNDHNQAQQSSEAPASAQAPASAPAPVPAPESAQAAVEEVSSKKKEKKRKREDKVGAAASEDVADSSASAPLEKKKKKDKSKEEDKQAPENESAEKKDKKEKKKEGKGKEKTSAGNGSADAVVNGQPHAGEEVDILPSLTSVAQAAGKEGKVFGEVLDACAYTLKLERSAVLDRLLANYKLKESKKGDLVLFRGNV